MIWSKGQSTHQARGPDWRIGDGKIFVSNIEEAIRIRMRIRTGMSI